MVRLLGRTLQKGFSIVELMVAILIGLIILAGVVQVVVTSKSTFLGQEEMSFIQENARYAMDVIGKDIQGAGYWGCAGNGAKAAMVARVAAENSSFMSRLPVGGFEGSSTITPPTAYASDIRVAVDADGDDIQPDSILVRGLRGHTSPVQSHVVGTLSLSADTSLSAGSFVGVVAEDCKRVGLFKASGVSADKRAITYNSTDNYVLSIKPSLDDEIICNPADGVCTNGTYLQMYGASASVMAYEAVAYYVGNSPILGSAPSVPVLKRAVLRGSTVVEEEIALGAENMQILYGVRNGNSMQYVAANAVTDWNNVAAVQVSILFRSLSASQPSVEDKDLLGNKYKDRFARQVVTSTYRLRNRI